MLSHVKKYAPIAYALIAGAVFLDSLRFKFTNAPETQVIFGKLDAWAAGFGAGGLFDQTGLFSQYVIGSAELVASTLLLIGLVPALRRLQTLGALIATAVMTGAVSFHLFTPLGIDPNNDGGGLFAMAVAVWLASIAYLLFHRSTLLSILTEVGRAILPGHARTVVERTSAPAKLASVQS
ncbi:hypothetical protein [Hyphomonas sp. UBA4494]|jgi:hypothetical protein|uniref:hypothetical protein n=1 Tax=Hyphomonas sp. UBA4494 TaxID=1946631 RepID=UPI0025C39AED|nr:hypothetical protein [Hyphomonas sp. UBA4494]